MQFNEYRATEAGKETLAHMSQGLTGLMLGDPKKCIPHNSHVAMGILASSHPTEMGRNVLATLSDACFNDPEFAEQVWAKIRQEVLRGQPIHE